MIRNWIAIALLAGSWLFGLAIISRTTWPFGLGY